MGPGVEKVGEWIVLSIAHCGLRGIRLRPAPAGFRGDKLGLFRLRPATGGLRRDKLGLIGFVFSSGCEAVFVRNSL